MPQPNQVVPPHTSLEMLKRLTEKLDGLRETSASIWYNPTTGKLAAFGKNEVKDGGPWLTLATILHTSDFQARPTIKLQTDPKLMKQPPGGGNKTEIGTVDAWFTSPAAVEKFVIPYYARVWGGQAAAELRQAFFKNGEALALFHEPESEPGFGVHDGSGFFAVIKTDGREDLQVETIEDFIKRSLA